MSDRNRNQNAIVRISSSDIAQGTTFTEKQVDLIREQIMPGASDDELMLFVQVASSRGLDPFRKHVYAVNRRAKDDRGNWVDKWSYQVSIDGLRLIAERTGKYEGQLGPFWCGPDGVWRDVWLDNAPPAAAKIGVFKTGFREPLIATARFSTYVQKTNKGEVTKFWASMPEVMIAKVAEAAALRRAFPEETGGLYVSEEMDQATTPADPSAIETPGRVVNQQTGEITQPRPTPARPPHPQPAAPAIETEWTEADWDNAIEELDALTSQHDIADLIILAYVQKKGYRDIVATPPSVIRALAHGIATNGPQPLFDWWAREDEKRRQHAPEASQSAADDVQDAEVVETAGGASQSGLRIEMSAEDEAAYQSKRRAAQAGQ